MTDRLFADCCYGTDLQHGANQPCPQEAAPMCRCSEEARNNRVAARLGAVFADHPTNTPMSGDDALDRLQYHLEKQANYIALPETNAKNTATARYHNEKARDALATLTTSNDLKDGRVQEAVTPTASDVERAREAVAELAQTRMDLSLERWGELSNAILAALNTEEGESRG